MYATSTRYAPSVRAGGSVQYSVCDAYLNGAPVAEATGLLVTAGSVIDTSAPGVRRTLDVEFAATPKLFDALSPLGMEMRVRTVIRYPEGSTEQIPMGVFLLESTSRSYEPGGTIKVQASDKWTRIQRSKFLVPEPVTAGIRVSDHIASLIRGALGNSEPVTVTATSDARTGAWYWERDRDKTILDLAESIGATVFFDRNGVATVADLPRADSSSVWLVDASASGVMLGADRDRNAADAANVVVVSSEATDGVEPFAPQIVWDTDPASPTYAGPDPFANPGGAGPFGVVPYFYSSPLLLSAASAQIAGRTILARVTGLGGQLSLSAVRNHALDVFDPIDALLPQERYDIPRAVEHHIIDKIVHPLTVDGQQQITTRALRSGDFT